MSTWIVVAITAVLAVGWIPVGVFFWRSWKRRGAPLSLAICALIGFPIYTNASTSLFLHNDPLWISGVLAGVNALILAYFYFCFKRQAKTFPSSRGTNGARSPN